jgi:hypothetical protein
MQRQAVHAAPHVGVADRQPHPNPRGNRDHRPDSALITAATEAAVVRASSNSCLIDILQIPDPLGVILRLWKLRGNEIRWQPTR